MNTQDRFHPDITQRPNSIVNPDVVTEWAAEDAKHPKRIKERATLAASLIPNIAAYRLGDVDRAKKAAELWTMEADSFKTAVLHRDGSKSIFHFWASEWTCGGKHNADVLAYKVAKMTISEALDFLTNSTRIFFPNHEQTTNAK